MGEPTTEAGKALLVDLAGTDAPLPGSVYADRILAIEAEARAEAIPDIVGAATEAERQIAVLREALGDILFMHEYDEARWKAGHAVLSDTQAGRKP